MKIKFVKKAMGSTEYKAIYDDLIKRYMNPSFSGEKRKTIDQAKLAAVEQVTKELLSALIQKIRSTYQNLKMGVPPVTQSPDDVGIENNGSDEISEMQGKIDTATTALQDMFEHIEAAQKIISTETPENYNFSIPRGLKEDWPKWQERDRDLTDRIQTGRE